MTKNLRWRLSKLPTVSELTELVKDKIITQEEAKQVLFTLETEEDRDKKSLESEIKFLRELVEQLSNRSKIIEVIREIKTPYYSAGWYQPYQVWCGAVSAINANGVNSTALLSSGTTTTNAVTNTALNGSASASNFADIKTF